jgi:phytoene synthase
MRLAETVGLLSRDRACLPLTPTALRADLRQCQQVLERASSSFSISARFVPAGTRPALVALYAFMRELDDLVDETADGRFLAAEPAALLANTAAHVPGVAAASSRAELVARALEARLEACIAGKPLDHPVDRATSSLIAASRLPVSCLRALRDGMERDAFRPESIVTYEDLVDYSVCVAGSVGVLAGFLLGAPSHTSLHRACDMGIGMQLTNIARDVGEDSRSGRRYIPASWLSQDVGTCSRPFSFEPRGSAEEDSDLIDQVCIATQRLVMKAEQVSRTLR